jgi:hypothetical protein
MARRAGPTTASTPTRIRSRRGRECRVRKEEVDRQPVPSLAQQRFEFAAASNNALDKRVLSIESVQHEIFADRKRSRARTEIVSPTTSARVSSKQEETRSQRIDQAVGDLNAAIGR